MFDPEQRAYVETARVGRLATADADGRPHVVPICFALVGDDLLSPIDEKPKSVGPSALRRSRDVAENPRVAVVVDHYTQDWADLGWVQVRGTATLLEPDHPDHRRARRALREKYEQYAGHDLETRPVVRVEPGTVLSWGALDRPDAGGDSTR